MARTDRRNPAGFLVRTHTSPLFLLIYLLLIFYSRVGAPMEAQISLHTLVFFVMKPRHTRAVPRLSLLGEQSADV